MILPEGIKVRLTVDLTKYHPILIKGVEGVTLAKDWNMDDCYMRCCFGGMTHKIVTKSLEIIDEAYLKKLKKEKEQQYADFLTASRVVKVVGSRGHYRLDVTYHCSIFGREMSRNFRGNKAVELEKFFRDASIHIEVKKE